MRSLLAFTAFATLASAQPTMHLTLAEAQRLAIQNNPQFTAAKFNAAAAYQVPLQYRSSLEPTVFGSITGVGADNGSRLAAGGLSLRPRPAGRSGRVIRKLISRRAASPSRTLAPKGAVAATARRSGMAPYREERTTRGRSSARASRRASGVVRSKVRIPSRWSTSC